MATSAFMDKEEETTTDLDLAPAPLSDEMFKQFVTSAPADMFATRIADRANARGVANEAAAMGRALGVANEATSTSRANSREEASPKARMENINKTYAGIPTTNFVLAMAGAIDANKLASHKEYFDVLTTINEYHTLCRAQHEVDTVSVTRFSDPILVKLNELESVLIKCRKTYNNRSSTKRKLMPTYSTILASIKPLKATFDMIRPLSLAYVSNTDSILTHYAVGDILDSKLAKMHGAHAVTTTGYSPEAKSTKKKSSLASKIEDTIIPSPDSKNFYTVLGEVENALTLLEAQGDSVSEKTLHNYYPLRRLIASVKNNKDILLKLGNTDDSKQLSSRDNDDLYMIRAIANGSVTVAKANDVLAYKQDKSFQQVSDGIGLGGAQLSNVWIDTPNHRILRESSKKDTVDKQMKQGNAYRDEALSKLNDLLDFNVIAKARTTKYKDAAGNEAFGSEMALAEGTEGGDLRFSTSTGETGGVDEINLGNESGMRVASDMIKLQLVDFIAGSSDRHGGNYFVNPNAPEGQSTITGIDNDQAFGRCVLKGTSMFLVNDGNRAAERSPKSPDLAHVTGINGLSVIPMGTMAKLDSIKPEMLKSVLGPYIASHEIVNAIRRLNILKAHLKSNSKELDFSKPESQETFKEELEKSLLDFVAHKTKSTSAGLESIGTPGAHSLFTGSAMMGAALYENRLKANASGRDKPELKVLLMGKTRQEFAQALEANGNIDAGKGTAAQILVEGSAYNKGFDAAEVELKKLLEEAGAKDVNDYTTSKSVVAEAKRKVVAEKAAEKEKAEKAARIAKAAEEKKAATNTVPTA